MKYHFFSSKTCLKCDDAKVRCNQKIPVMTVCYESSIFRYSSAIYGFDGNERIGGVEWALLSPDVTLYRSTFL